MNNSIAAFNTLDIAQRESLVFQIYYDNGSPLTDREVGEILTGDGDSVNKVQPRITRLLEADIGLFKTGDIICETTGRRCRCVMFDSNGKGDLPF